MKARITLPTLVMAIFFLFSFGLDAQDWSQIGSFEGVEIVSFHSNEAGYDFAFINQSRQYYRRHKDESDWSPLNIPLALSNIDKIKIGKGGNIYIYSTGFEEWYASPDNGDTWEVMVNPFPFENIGFLEDMGNGVMFITNTNKLYRSANNGESWAKVLTSDQSSPFNKIVTDPVSGEMFIYSGAIGQGSMVYNSTNGGINWNGIGLFSNVNDMVFHPSNGTLLIATNDGIKQRAPGTNNFELMQGQPNSEGVLKIQFLPSGRLVALDKETFFYGDAFYSDDEGSSWTKVDEGESNSISNFHLTPFGEILGFRQGIVCSKDNGENWALDMVGINHGVIYDYCENDAGVWFAASNSGVFRSFDEGQSWQRINRNFTLGLPEIEVNGNGHLYIYYSGELLISEDNGDSFAAFSAPELGLINTSNSFNGRRKKFKVHPSGALLVLVQGEMVRSVDNGVTWDSSPCISGAWGINLTIDGTIVIANNMSLSISNDVGATWSTQSRPADTFWSSDKFYVFNDGLISFSHQAFSQTKLYQTTDFGATWVEEDIPSSSGSFYDNYFVNDANFLFKPYGYSIQFSADRGKELVEISFEFL